MLPTETDQAFADIGLLLHAIQERLTLAGSDTFAADCLDRGQGPGLVIRTTVIDCVAELTRLHARVRDEAAYRRRLDRVADELRTALAAAQAELLHTRSSARAANHPPAQDGLTRLPNADYFRHKVDVALRSAQATKRPVAVMVVDLNGFKAINERHGHALGDSVLRIVSMRLAGGIRSDDFVGRVGGDEFACLLPGVPTREQLGHLMCKLFDAVSSPMHLGEVSLVVKPSIGVAVYPADASTSALLTRHADTAMGMAKQQKCGYAYYDECAGMVPGGDASGDAPGVDLPLFGTLGQHGSTTHPPLFSYGAGDSKEGAVADVPARRLRGIGDRRDAPPAARQAEA